MGMYVNPNNNLFSMSVNSEIYVDKTGLIEYTNSALRTEKRFICVTRPRRFGKSMAANMLAAYYSNGCCSGELFCNFKICNSAAYEENLNKWNVIRIDMNSFVDASLKNSELVPNLQQTIVNELRIEFPDCINDTAKTLKSALISIYLKYGFQFIFIIDEWDAFFRYYANDADLLEQYVAMLRSLFKSADGSETIAMTYLTGILPIKKYKVESSLNNFDEFTMLDPGELAGYIGFTESEVKELCNKYGSNFQSLHDWYDGYVVKDLHIYNPNAVVNALRSGVCKSYWSKTGAFDLLRDYIVMDFDGLKDAVTELLGENYCRIDTSDFQNDMTSIKNRDNVLTLLVHLGYLGYLPTDSDHGDVFIPNKEVRNAFLSAMKNAKWDGVLHAVNESNKLLEATWRHEEQFVAELIEKVHQESISLLKYNDENALSCVISLAYFSAKDYYHIARELPAGKGFADLVFIPKQPGIIPMVVELKWDKSAETAIGQIKEKGYFEVLKGYGHVLLAGINYNKSSKKHECRIEELAFKHSYG